MNIYQNHRLAETGEGHVYELIAYEFEPDPNSIFALDTKFVFFTDDNLRAVVEAFAQRGFTVTATAKTWTHLPSGEVFKPIEERKKLIGPMELVVSGLNPKLEEPELLLWQVLSDCFGRPGNTLVYYKDREVWNIEPDGNNFMYIDGTGLYYADGIPFYDC